MLLDSAYRILRLDGYRVILGDWIAVRGVGSCLYLIGRDGLGGCNLRLGVCGGKGGKGKSGVDVEPWIGQPFDIVTSSNPQIILPTRS